VKLFYIYIHKNWKAGTARGSGLIVASSKEESLKEAPTYIKDGIKNGYDYFIEEITEQNIAKYIVGYHQAQEYIIDFKVKSKEQWHKTENTLKLFEISIDINEQLLALATIPSKPALVISSSEEEVLDNSFCGKEIIDSGCNYSITEIDGERLADRVLNQNQSQKYSLEFTIKPKEKNS